MDTTEGQWGIFEDCWARYKRMSGLTDLERGRDELMECCTKQLNTRMVQMHGLGSCNKDQLLRFIKTIAMRGVHKHASAAGGFIPSLRSKAQGEGRTKPVYDGSPSV